MHKIYYQTIKTETICKNGSVKFGVKASSKFFADLNKRFFDIEIAGKTKNEAEQKLISFLSDKNLTEIIEVDVSQLNIIPGKSAERVRKSFLKYPDDWNRQYDMLLMDGMTCSNCCHSERCRVIFDGNDLNTSCQFHPNRFQKA